MICTVCGRKKGHADWCSHSEEPAPRSRVVPPQEPASVPNAGYVVAHDETVTLCLDSGACILPKGHTGPHTNRVNYRREADAAPAQASEVGELNAEIVILQQQLEAARAALPERERAAWNAALAALDEWVVAGKHETFDADEAYAAWQARQSKEPGGVS